MITLIFGAKGSGKTKRIIDKANAGIDKANGHIVFVTDTKRYSLDIKYQIRLLDTNEYGINNRDSFLGFIKGIVASNGDLSELYIDGIARITAMDINDMEDVYAELDKLAKAAGIELTITVSSDKLPEYMKKYIQ